MALTHVTSGYYEGKTITELERGVLFELGKVVNKTVNFANFPQWYIREKVNGKMNEFVYKTECLSKMALIRCLGGKRQYRLPLNCMENGVTSAQYFYSSSSYTDLEIVDRAYMFETMGGWLTAGQSDPTYIFPGQSAGNVPSIEVHPTPSADGTSYLTDVDTGVVTGGDLPGSITNTTGQATGGSTSTLTDSVVDFTELGLAAGMAVVKTYGATNAVTPGLEPIGYILTVAAHTITCTTVLTNSGQFDAGDSYEILSGEYGVLINATDDNNDMYLFSSEVGALASLTVPAGNIRIEYVPYPVQFPESGNPYQIPEIPKLWHPALICGVAAEILRTFNEQSKEFKRAEYYSAFWVRAILSAKSKKGNKPFQTKPARIIPRIK